MCSYAGAQVQQLPFVRSRCNQLPLSSLQGIEPAPVFRPTEEDFADPLAYINSCRPEGERCGIVCIVPPPSFK